MRDYIFQHIKLQNLLCSLILFSRIGDIGSTYLATPKLKLEANPLVRKLGWWFAVASILLCLVPYYSTALAILVLIPSLMVSAANTSKIGFVRVYGEDEYHDLLLSLAQKSRLAHALAPLIGAAMFFALVGFLLLFLCPNPNLDWGYWFGFGFLVYALAVGLRGSSFMIRLFRNARRREKQPHL